MVKVRRKVNSDKYFDTEGVPLLHHQLQQKINGKWESTLG
jgi:hypothetical protein